MKPRYLLLGLVMGMTSCSFLSAQTDTTRTQTDTTLAPIDTTRSSGGELNTEITLASRNIWRGLDYGSSPSAQATLAYETEFFEVGTFGTIPLNGSKKGYGTWLEVYATVKYKGFSLTLDDYFFFNEADSANTYFDWNQNTTQHFVEARLAWSNDVLSVMAGYVIYKNKADKTNGVYIEAEYSPFEHVSFIAGGLTGANWLSFYDNSGVTTLGVSATRLLPMAPKFQPEFKASLIVNPSYNKSVNAPGVGTNPIYLVVALSF